MKNINCLPKTRHAQNKKNMGFWKKKKNLDEAQTFEK